MNRDFKGIWIPREIWLSEDLTLQEKILWVEINSLDTYGEGCYASNGYFASFFGLTANWISQLISSLEKKKYIRITGLEKGGNKRRLHSEGGITPVKGGYYSSQTPLHINTLNNKADTEKKLTTKKVSFKRTKDPDGKKIRNSPIVYGRITMSQFRDFWRLYPRHVDEGKTLKNWSTICSKPAILRPKWRVIKQAILDQKQTPRWNKEGGKFIAYPATWLNQSQWLNDPALMDETWRDDKKQVNGNFRTGALPAGFVVDDGTVQSICIADDAGNPNAITINRKDVSKNEWQYYWKQSFE